MVGSPAPAGQYDAAFYDELWEGGRSAARSVLPPVIRDAGVTSIVDVGCGGGAWLSVAAELGVTDLVGLDRAGAREASRRFDDLDFVATDLHQRFSVARRFDLAMSIEVAEHLPGHRASTFVDDLCRLAPLVLFSAAYPGQGGTGHVNEQWPSYWCERFAANGYVPLDVCRARLWTDPEAPIVVKMNVLLYADPDALGRVRHRWEPPVVLDVVHPRLWDEVVDVHRTVAHRAAGRIDAVVRTIGGRVRGRP